MSAVHNGDFCGTGCQSNCQQPPATTFNNGSVQNLVIGYWGAWSLDASGCSARKLSDVPVDSLTHLNVAFGYIDPGTFEIFPMPGVTTRDFSDLANLKRKAPGLKVVWIDRGILNRSLLKTLSGSLLVAGLSMMWNDTITDSGKPTQPVFSALSQTSASRSTFINNLIKFMSEFGFDGVDIDWEYPGAPDRGGSPFDTPNYVRLLQDIQSAFSSNTLGNSWGLSFTAPTSYWYLRWFDIGEMIQYANWMNLMTYDLHGSWDSPSDDIGSFVYAHTNLTEIYDALNLLWRNDVPANQVNLGLGFYGRTYVLSDPTCVLPGCPFSAPGLPGLCSQQEGILSFDEIQSLRKRSNPNIVYDKVAAVKYFSYGQNEWASYDDVETLAQKVTVAGELGLLGLFIWSIDLDNLNHDALNAVLQPTGLGKFSYQNGVGSFGTTQYIGAIGDSCYFGDCGDPGTCPSGMIQMGPQLDCIGHGGTQPLCCPLSIAPDDALCSWNIGNGNPAFGLCQGACPPGQNRLAESQFPNIDGIGPVYCGKGVGEYCCHTTETLQDGCNFEPNCLDLDKDGVPINACQSDSRQPKYVTYRRGPCSGNKVNAFCCRPEIDASSCVWKGKSTAGGDCVDNTCSPDQVPITTDLLGGGKSCSTHSSPNNFNGAVSFGNDPMALCCGKSALDVNQIQLPFDVDNLFPGGVPSTDKQSLKLDVDPDLGEGGNSEDPELHAFGMVLMSGPSTEITSFDKRDGSHWEIYDCPEEKHDGRQTVKAVCTDDSADSNCGVIFTGTGVKYTVVELPRGCSVGRYVVAISLEPSEDHRMPQKLVKRGLSNKPVYDFTFDYNFNAFEKRDSSVKVRIDYSDVPGYWDEVILPPGDLNTRRKRDIEVQEQHGGNYKRWLEHTWRQERRETPDHKLDELHKRWYSLNPLEWFEKWREVDENYGGPHQSASGQYTLDIVDENLDCGVTHATLNSYANLQYQMSVSTGVAIIGTLGDWESWKQSNIYFRTTGDVKATFVFDAFARITLTTGQIELFGLQNFPSPFTVSGLVTIGPNLRILAELTGEATLHAGYVAELEIAKWDYKQTYPATAGTSPQDNAPEELSSAPWAPLSNPPTITWDVTANGQIVAHIIPRLELGIIFASDYLGDATVGLGIDAFVRAYANASVSSTHITPSYCYGVDGGANLFAYVNTPRMFGTNYDFNWTPWQKQFEILPATCQDINFKLNGGEPGGFE
ncbi:family 18 glycosyl hydrolase [Xylogone sp. PMI_703]|nr:family 18 glycosyl hydrolase [Xylogone sp. PMI_703]